MSAPAGDVWFYHLERSSLEQVLPELLSKTLERGWRALVRGVDEERLTGLDEALWSWRADSFLPHGTTLGPNAERQPVLLTADTHSANGAQALFVIDGAPMDDAPAFERCLVLFDGRDDDAVAEARRRWKTVTTSGASASYWKQTDDGRWTKAG